VPSDMDGKVLTGWLGEGFRYDVGPASPSPPTVAARQADSGLSEEEVAQVTERLRDLGYVE